MVAEPPKDVPDYLLADPVAPELMWGKGSLGSTVLALRGGHLDVLEKMADCYAERFRKSWRDLREGLAVFMAPSREHERRARHSSGLVESLGAAMGLAVVALASTTLRVRGEGRSGDPDESFYIGRKAEAYLEMERSGVAETEIHAWADDQPADLVVEVEHTHYDETKRGIYRDAGAAELWELATPQAGKDARIIQLQAPEGPLLVGASELMPGVRGDGIADALAVLRRVGGLIELGRAMERGEPVADELLQAVGAQGRDGS